jgi:hypothetical protein
VRLISPFTSPFGERRDVRRRVLSNLGRRLPAPLCVGISRVVFGVLPKKVFGVFLSV